MRAGGPGFRRLARAAERLPDDGPIGREVRRTTQSEGGLQHRGVAGRAAACAVLRLHDAVL